MSTRQPGCRRVIPWRAIRAIVNEALDDLSPIFAGLHAPLGRPSIPPEQRLRALLLQAFHAIRSERQPIERRDFDPWFRWFVGRGIDDPVWGHSTFSDCWAGATTTATGCSRARSLPSSWPCCSTGPRCAGCGPAGIAASTAG
jgi:hypothetical protein